LEPLKILQYLRNRLDRKWAGDTVYTIEAFLTDIGDVASVSVASRTLAGGRASEKIVGALRFSAARNRVAARLNLPQLFECEDLAAVDRLIEQRDGGANSQAGDVLFEEERVSPAHDPFVLADAELAAQKLLVSQICDGNQLVVGWLASFGSGASFIAYTLKSNLSIAKHFSKIFVVRPTSSHTPYEDELASLERHLRTPRRQIGSCEELINALVEDKALLILLDADRIPHDGQNPRSTFARRLIHTATNWSSDWTNPAHIVAIGNSRVIDTSVASAKDFSVEIDSKLRVSSKTAFTVFQSQWHRFCRLRGVAPGEDFGSRMKRAYWHYESLKDKKIWPINIRVRAFFASNMENFACFDPTPGFNYLAGPVSTLPKDVESFLKDHQSYIGGFSGKQRDANVRALRYVSTGKYWLTGEALEVLIEGNEDPHIPQSDLLSFTRRLSELRPIVEDVPNKSTRPEDGLRWRRFVSSLGAKAVIQQHWRESAPADRSLAHYRIAARLREHQNDKEMLVEEFPYEPHWGRSRIFFLAECLRHLIRACDTVEQKSPRVLDAAELREFPSPPTGSLGGCDPVQVINYCYQVLYHAELNGNRGEKARALAKRHGAYQLSVELLQMMSDRGQIGRPHQALMPVHHRAFIKDCGFALLDIGELAQAEQCFRSILELTDVIGIQRVEDCLDLTLVLAVSGDTAHAWQVLSDAEAAMNNKEMKEGANSTARRDLRKIARRLLGRKAHLYYLDADYNEALRCFDKMEDGSRQSDASADRDDDLSLIPMSGPVTEPDLVHVQIAALMNAEPVDSPKTTDNQERAFELCIKAMFRASSEGLQHEAMGFRISFAHLLRKQGKIAAAETLMDQVHAEILRFGCSERTFLAFLLEAGRILVAKGMSLRAYASYLRPCILRARSRGYTRQEAIALKYAAQALEDSKARLRETPPDEWHRHVHEQIDMQRALRQKDKPRSFGRSARDPLYGYSIAESESVIGDLARIEGIERHKNDLLPRREAASSLAGPGT
jgi:tetratricopeptide (TPR) repeat protein